MAIFSHFTEKVPGSYRAKNPENGQKRPEKRQKRLFLAKKAKNGVFGGFCP